MTAIHAVLRDPFGMIVAEGDLDLSPDVPMIESTETWHDQLREFLTPGKRMQLAGSSPNAALLFDLQVTWM
jgi:hypothetical protein